MSLLSDLKQQRSDKLEHLKTLRGNIMGLRSSVDATNKEIEELEIAIIALEQK